MFLEFPDLGFLQLLLKMFLDAQNRLKLKLNASRMKFQITFHLMVMEQNDYWALPKIDCFPDFEATVYDRQGRLIYQFSDDIGWDGTYNGNYLPSTDYWYSIKLNEYTNPITGHFNLYR